MTLELYRKPAPTPTRREPRRASGRGWERKRFGSLAIRALGLAIPLVASGAVAMGVNAVLPASTRVPLIIARTLVVIAASMAAVFAVDRAVRRFLPLATLLQLSLVFPDQAPSRFRLALKAGSGRNIARLVEHTRAHGLDDDPQAAAEQVLVLIGALGEHDRRTRGHSERVRLYSDLIGQELRLTVEERQKLQWGALLHDLGKIETPIEILNKKGSLTSEEWEIMRRHPEAGRRLLRPLIPFLGEWGEAVWKHHERWDGAGYPRQIPALRIGRAAAIVAVADSFEVMTSARSYKKAWSVAEARAELTKCAGSQFSPEVVRAFVSVSLGRVRIAMGPLAALSHLPFLQRMIEVPAVMSASVTNTVSAAMTAAAPTVAVGAVTVSAMMATGTIEAPPAYEAHAGVVVAADLPAQPAGAAIGGGASGSAITTTEPASARPPGGGPTTTTPQSSTTPTSAGPSASSIGDKSATSTVTTVSSPTTTSTTAGPRTTTTTTSSTANTTTTVAAAATPTAAPTTAGVIYVSLSANRVNASQLNGKTFDAGTDVYVFVRTNAAVANVRFYKYANPSGDGTPYSTELHGEYDLESTNADGTARPWTPGNGTKTVTAVITYAGGATEILIARFQVRN